MPADPPPWLADKRWIWGFALLVMALTGLPYLLGYARQGEEWQFTGILFGVEDGNSYIAKMLRGAEGDWLFRTPYTPFSQRGVLLYFPYLLLGKLTAPPGRHEQLVALYQLFRLAAGVGLVFASYAFLSIYIRERVWRRFGTALLVLGGGLGWLSVVGAGVLWGGEMPLDFYSPEAFGFLMIFGLPHLAVARALVLWGLREYLLAVDQTLTQAAMIKIGLIWVGVWLFQPLMIIIAWAVIGAHLAFTWVWQIRRGNLAEWSIWRQYIKRGFVIGVFSVPPMLYTLLSFRMDPILSSWEAQNQLSSAPFHHYILAYALLLIPAVPGAGVLLRDKPWTGFLIVAWAVLFPVLINLPIGAQRRLVEGAWVVIVILALSWIEMLGKPLRKWALIGLSPSFFTFLITFLGSLITVWNPHTPLYRPAQEVEMFEFLEENADSADVVLASFETSNPMPAWAPVRTVTGHGPEGFNGNEMRGLVGRFYKREMTEYERIEFLKNFGITYVFWGPTERSLGDWDPRQEGYLTPVFENGPYLLLHIDMLP